MRFPARLATVLLALSGLPAHSQGTWNPTQKFVILTAASTNCQTVGNPGPHQITEMTLTNNSSAMYLHLYDTATIPAAGSLGGQVGVYIVPTTGAGVPNFGSVGVTMQNGIGICITGGMPLADSSNASAGGVVDFTVSAIK